MILEISKGKLDKLAKELKDKNVKKITLTGNSNVKVNEKGENVKNDDIIEVDDVKMTVRELKLKRAEAVKEYLKSQGVKDSKMDVKAGVDAKMNTEITIQKKIKP